MRHIDHRSVRRVSVNTKQEEEGWVLLQGNEAVVEGAPSRPSGTLRHTLRRAGLHRKTRVVGPEQSCGKEAVLAYEIMGSSLGRSLLRIQLFTGRSHQIRAQLADMGHPIIGDKKYGSRAKLWSGIGLFWKSRNGYEGNWPGFGNSATIRA